MRSRSKKKGGLLRLALWTLAVAVVTAAGLAAYGWSWAQAYMKSPAFTQLIARQLGRVSRADVAIEPLSWTGSSVYGSRVTLTPTSARGWKSIEAEGVQATLDFGAVRQGTWSIDRVDMDRLRMELGAATSEAPASTEEEHEAPAAVPGWLKGWIPTKTQIGEVSVQTFDLQPSSGSSGLSASGIAVKAHTATDPGAWLLRGEGGKLNVPSLGDPFRLTSISCRLDEKALTINDCVARWKGESEITAHGEFPFEEGRGWKIAGHAANLDLRQVLGPEWTPKLSGVLEGDYTATSQPAADVLFKATLAVKSGVVQGLPVLDQIASYTHTERFRRVVLDQATGDVEQQGAFTKISNLVLQSNGLLRIEGGMTIKDRRVVGSFFVGVSPETLRWIPGAQGHVFTESRSGGPPGFVWTTVNLTGTTDSLREDLTNRLLAAAGKAIIEAPLDAAGKGVELLGSGGKAAVGGGKAILDTGKGAVKGAADVLEKGVEAGAGLLKGVFGR